MRGETSIARGLNETGGTPASWTRGGRTGPGRRLRALQSAIFNSATFSMIATDEKGVIQIFNVGAQRMLGYAATEVVNQITPADVSDPKEVIARAATLSRELSTSIAPGFEAMVYKAARGIEDIYELTYIRKNGTRIPAIVSVTALRDDDGAMIGSLLIGTDNSVRRGVEEQLRWTEESFRLMVESVTDYAIVMLDPQGLVVSWNSGAQRIKGYRADEIVGEHFSRFYSRQDIDHGKPQRDLDVATAKGRFEDEGLRTRKDGSVFWANEVVTAIRDPGGDLRGFAKLTRDLTESMKVEAQLRTRLSYLAQYDVLTELPNRSQFRDRMGGAMARATRNKQLLGIMFLRLDNFQTVNATLGRHVGDIVLKQMAERLKLDARQSDTVARVGGDEFSVLLEGLAGKEAAALVSQRKMESLSRPVLFEGQEVRLTASIGITVFPPDADNLEALLRNADVAMNYATECGCNNYQFFSPELNVRTRRNETQRAEIEQRMTSLTPREREVLDLLVAGRPNKMAAYLLGTSTRTIENHRARIMDKMKADSLPELVRMSMHPSAPLPGTADKCSARRRATDA